MEKAFGAAEVKVDETYTVPDQVRQYPITLDKLPDQLPENAPIICE